MNTVIFAIYEYFDCTLWCQVTETNDDNFLLIVNLFVNLLNVFKPNLEFILSNENAYFFNL